ncbi:MAG: tRNA-dihydrouridine synthase, partial [Bacteroidales bacterium]|nr:tRNA-dihydrouridine synthase [Bacteroidales bacterium]
MIKVLYAPLQGYTDAIYRTLHNKHFGGIDKYYAPYLRFEPNKEPKKSVINDFLPNNNKHIELIPQLLGKDIKLFIDHIKKLQDLGYSEVNWNLACPYPMV